MDLPSTSANIRSARPRHVLGRAPAVGTGAARLSPGQLDGTRHFGLPDLAVARAAGGARRAIGRDDVRGASGMRGERGLGRRHRNRRIVHDVPGIDAGLLEVFGRSRARCPALAHAPAWFPLRFGDRTLRCGDWHGSGKRSATGCDDRYPVVEKWPRDETHAGACGAHRRAGPVGHLHSDDGSRFRRPGPCRDPRRIAYGVGNSGGPIVLVLRGKTALARSAGLYLSTLGDRSQPVVATCAACGRASGCGGTVVVSSASGGGLVPRYSFLESLYCHDSLPGP